MLTELDSHCFACLRKWSFAQLVMNTQASKEKQAEKPFGGKETYRMDVIIFFNMEQFPY